jgi:hypothetical protein
LAVDLLVVHGLSVPVAVEAEVPRVAVLAMEVLEAKLVMVDLVEQVVDVQIATVNLVVLNAAAPEMMLQVVVDPVVDIGQVVAAVILDVISRVPAVVEEEAITVPSPRPEVLVLLDEVDTI